MSPHSPAKKRCKVVEARSPCLSPGTKKARKKTKELIINQAAMELIATIGDADRAPYGSIKKILQRYRNQGISRRQVQKRVDKIKENVLSGRCAPSRLFPSPPAEEIHVTPNNSSASTPTGRASHGGAGDDPRSSSGRANSAASVGVSSSGRVTGGRPKGTTNEAKQNREDL
jgi:hypothetical protein